MPKAFPRLSSDIGSALINKTTSSALTNAAFFGCSGLCVYLLADADVLNIRLTYAVLTVLLLIYLWLEVTRIRRVQPERWLLNPAVVCALMTFVMGYGMTNVLFFLPPESIEFLGLVPEVLPAMVKHQYLVLLGAIALFFGYWSPMAQRLTRPVAVARFQRRFLPGTDVLKRWALPFLVAVSVAARLFAIRQGVYGYGGDFSAERIAETGAYSQYLGMAGSLGKLALVLVALQYFAPESGRKSRLWFWGILLIEIFFGFLSGMKSAVGMPIVIAGICLYLRTGRIPKSWIVMTILSISVAYAVIEPFRAVHNKQGGPVTSVSETIDLISRGVSGEASSRKRKDEDSESTIITVASRSNLSYIGSFALEYADTHPELPAGSPAFLEDLFWAPLYAWVPRFLWSSKPMGNLGTWYNQVVLGASLSSITSVAMGPFAYLYFAGGYLAVAVVFFLIGVLQRTFLFVLTPFVRSSGTVVFLSILQLLGTIDSSILGLLISLFRDVPILLVVMLLIYQRRAPSPHGRLGIPTRDPRYHTLRHGSAG